MDAWKSYIQLILPLLGIFKRASLPLRNTLLHAVNSFKHKYTLISWSSKVTLKLLLVKKSVSFDRRLVINVNEQKPGNNKCSSTPPCQWQAFAKQQPTTQRLHSLHLQTTLQFAQQQIRWNMISSTLFPLYCNFLYVLPVAMVVWLQCSMFVLLVLGMTLFLHKGANSNTEK